MSDELPWSTVKLAELATKVGSGSTPRGGNESYKSIGIPLIRSLNVHFDGVRDEGLAFIDEEQARALDGVTVKTDDVLLNITGASIGRVATAPEHLDGARVNQHVCIIRVKPPLDAQFLRQFLSSPSQQKLIMAEESGATRQALTKEKILNFDIPLPPINEQRRIVAKLKTLQERSQKAREHLEAVPLLLEKLRQSILASAFRGDLTKAWREQNKEVEPATELLKRIRKERRKKWEEAELAKMKAKGKAPSDDKWKGKYQEPEAVDATGLPELPEGWCWASVEELCPIDAPAVYGIILPGDDVPEGVPYVRPVDMRDDGSIDFTSMKRTTPEIAEQYSRAALATGDIILSIVGTIGKVIITPPELNGGNITQSSARIRPPSWLSSEYIALVLQSSVLIRQFDRFRFGNAVQRLNVEHVRKLAIPIAPIKEAPVVIEKARKALARLPSAIVDNLRAELSTLDRAILSKAFRGELVPQDPKDEPAHLMLNRLQSSPPPSKKQRKTSKDGAKGKGSSP